MEEFSRRRSNRITDPFDVVDYTLTAEASAARQKHAQHQQEQRGDVDERRSCFFVREAVPRVF